MAPITKLRTDGGPEFAGAFSTLLERRGIAHERTGAGTHERLARLDRFHGTLRRMIGEHFALTRSHVWEDVLPALIHNYNEDSLPRTNLLRGVISRPPISGLRKSRSYAKTTFCELLRYDAKLTRVALGPGLVSGYCMLERKKDLATSREIA